VGAYTVLGLLTLWQWRRRRDRASVWAALAFGGLALIVLAGRVLDDDQSELELRIGRVLLAVLVLFPYFLYRFMRTFSPRPALVDHAVLPLTAALIVAGLVLPRFPQEGEPAPWWFSTYLLAFLSHWTLLSVLVTVRLWRAGAGQPGVARRRMRWLATASAALTFAILLTVFSSGDESVVGLLVQLGALAAALAFMLALSPPAIVRIAWRRAEQQRFGDAVSTLMSATTEQQVAAAVLPRIARLVGADAVVLRDEHGNELGEYHARAEATVPPEPPLVLAVDGGALELWTGPYAPFFGDDELRLAQTLARLTALALDRTRLFAREREARAALERADELKSQFVELAAHELRSPVAALYGTVDTLDRLAHRLSEDERASLRGLLRSQVERLRLLTEQLLDLSRLDAEAIDLEPVPLRVRERIETIVTSVVGRETSGLEIDVDPELEAVVDPEAFDRIASNLVGNALKYGEPPIRVAAEQRDRHFRLVVEDRGPGVAAEFQPQLFDRFARSGSSKERAEGTGLGLAIAHAYARAHGGDLVYEPAAPQGARFELVVPRRADG
jgi:signal transduction histidine kinase